MAQLLPLWRSPSVPKESARVEAAVSQWTTLTNIFDANIHAQLNRCHSINGRARLLLLPCCMVPHLTGLDAWLVVLCLHSLYAALMQQHDSGCCCKYRSSHHGPIKLPSGVAHQTVATCMCILAALSAYCSSCIPAMNAMHNCKDSHLDSGLSISTAPVNGPPVQCKRSRWILPSLQHLQRQAVQLIRKATVLSHYLT